MNYDNEIIEKLKSNRFSYLQKTRDNTALKFILDEIKNEPKTVVIYADKQNRQRLINDIFNILNEKHKSERFLKSGLFEFKNKSRIIISASTNRPALGVKVDILYVFIDHRKHDMLKNLYPTMASYSDSRMIVEYDLTIYDKCYSDFIDKLENDYNLVCVD